MSEDTLRRWLENRNQNKLIGDFLVENDYKNIVIYGAGDMGHLLYDEIKNAGIRILCFVDKNAETINQVDAIPVITFEHLEYDDRIDIVIVSTVKIQDSIISLFAERMPMLPTISLRDIVYQI